MTIETLFYPLHWLDDLIDEFKLNVCMDIGHLILRDIPLLDVFEPYRDHITMLHLHGVENGKDHQPLTHLSESSWKALAHILRSYHSAVSIEVFSYHHLRDSLEALDDKWNNYSEASKPKAPFYFKSQS